MKHKSVKYFIAVYMMLVSVSVAQAGPLRSGSDVRTDITNGAQNAANSFDGSLSGSTLKGNFQRIIDIFLGFLGLLFTVIVLKAGYNWITANGDEKKVKEAKDTLQRAVIGLAIILAAYAITYFVFNSADKVVGPDFVGPIQ